MSTPLDWSDNDIVIDVPEASISVVDAPAPSSQEILVLPGPEGRGFTPAGYVDTYEELPDDLGPDDAGDSYIVGPEGLVYTWSGTAWPAAEDGWTIKGAKGDDGDEGRGIESISASGSTLTVTYTDGSTDDVSIPSLAAAVADAVAARNAAQAARDAALGYAGAADDSADAAASSAAAAAGSANAAAVSEGNAADSAAEAQGYAEDAGEIVASGIPNATPSVKGGIRLAGDLGGTWDAPTVPRLDTLQLDDLQRYTRRGYAPSQEFHRLAEFPIDDSSNAASLVVTGRLGGWTTANNAYWTILLGNRSESYDGETVSASVFVSGNVAQALGTCELVAYAQPDGSAVLYVRIPADQYYAYDLAVNSWDVSIEYTGSAEAPTGSEVWSLEDAPKFQVWPNGQAAVGQVQLGSTATESNHAVPLWQANAALAAKADLVGGKLSIAQLPDLAIQEFKGVVANEAGMIAISAERGDWVTRTDTGSDWQVIAEPSSSAANWRQKTTPSDVVSSVAGLVGAITASALKTALALQNVSNTSDATKNTATATLSGKTMDGGSNTFTNIAKTSLVGSVQTSLGLADTSVQPAILAAAQRIAINAQTGTTYTLVAADETKAVAVSNASAITVTVPPNSSVAFAVGSVIEVRQMGAGQITLAPGSGVTIRTASTLKTRAQYSAVTLTKIGTDEWLAAGDMALT